MDRARDRAGRERPSFFQKIGGPGGASFRAPWSRGESRAERAVKPQLAESLRLAVRDWRRPVLAATPCLILWPSLRTVRAPAACTADFPASTCTTFAAQSAVPKVAESRPALSCTNRTDCAFCPRRSTSTYFRSDRRPQTRAVSPMHCVTVSLAAGGAGLGDGDRREGRTRDRAGCGLHPLRAACDRRPLKPVLRCPQVASPACGRGDRCAPIGRGLELDFAGPSRPRRLATESPRRA